MATKKLFGALLLSVLFAFTSCIQEEALNAECDIIAFDETWLEENKSLFSATPIIPNSLPTELFVYFKEGTSIDTIKSKEPRFKLTHGATIEKTDTTDNGNNGIIISYRTTSQDGMYHRDYKVYLTVRTWIKRGKPFSFESYEPEQKGRYNIWYEEDDGTKLYWWASGNAGIAIINPKTYPTEVEENGYNGKCVKLETCKTNKTAATYGGMPIAAGNIFLGEFDSSNAMGNALASTRFGLQIVPGKPHSLRGWYKYTPGETFTNKAQEIIYERRDTCAIYSVLYEVDATNFVPLNGSNVLSDECIVMVAELDNPGEPQEWTEFEIPYVTRNGKTFDAEKLKNGEYAITVVASSSKDGAHFEGAIGSRLYVDELEIIWEDE